MIGPVRFCTHPRIYNPPTPLDAAFEQVGCWLKAPTLMMLHEGPGYLSSFQAIVEQTRVVGGAIHDARIAGLCRFHGVSQLLTSDRDFSRFQGLNTRNPLQT